MPSEIPIMEVVELIKKNLSNEEITREMESKGFNLEQISNALNQANIKQEVEGNMPEEQQSVPEAQPQEQPVQQEIPVPEESTMGQAIPTQESTYGAQDQGYQQPYYPQQAGAAYGDVQAIVEQVIEEKWKDMMKDTGDIKVFKARVADDIEAIKQEVIRTQKRLEDLQVAVMGKVKDYNTSVVKIGSDMKALEQVFGKILEPLTLNIKELGRITEELKSKKK